MEGTRVKAKADWESWKEAVKQREALDLQINGLFLFEWDDLSEKALRDADKHLRQRRNAYEEEAKNVCARLHSGIMLSVIDGVDNDSMKGDDNNKGNGVKEMSIGGSGFSVPSPGYNCKDGTVLIDFQSSSDNVDGDGNNNNSTSGIHGLYNNSKILSEEEAEDVCVVSHKENSRRIDIGKVDNNNNNNHVHDNKSNKDNNDNKIPLKIQGADLRRYNKYKKRLHVMTAPIWYNCKKGMLKQECIGVGWVRISSLLLLYTESMELQKLYRI